mmetsp:Transcript_10904/g.22229  ORF Transcript_10904/g.22229 Transcript_10904/m.22229 type:complete len:438 (+) Transcript_10904:142-1455(+)
MSTSLLTLPYLAKTAANPHAPVAKWILGTGGLVAGMVHIGGVTRLTKSGLSMTDWKPLGSLPPLTTDEWMVEFERYKQYPEWQQRKSMDLEEFKYIFYWEWGHRMLGRTVGLAFAAPWAYFAARGRIPPGYHGRMALLFAMGGTQGLVGWWMVKSGLGDDRRGDRNEIRVSPYRLAAHLGMAVATYGTLVYTGLGVLSVPHDAARAGAGAGGAGSGGGGGTSKLQQLARSLSSSAMTHARKLRVGAMGVTGLTAATILSGAFVAGNDAGNAYNTFPKMNEQWIPSEDMVDPALRPKWRNLFENTATVQWNHRLLGTSTAVSALALAGLGLAHPAARNAVTPQARRGLQVLGGVAVGQVSLGIATLLHYVPIGLAAAHQLGSLAVLTSGIYVAHSLRYASPALMRGAAKEVGAKVATTAAGVGKGGVAPAMPAMKMAK